MHFCLSGLSALRGESEFYKNPMISQRLAMIKGRSDLRIIRDSHKLWVSCTHSRGERHRGREGGGLSPPPPTLATCILSHYKCPLVDVCYNKMLQREKYSAPPLSTCCLLCIGCMKGCWAIVNNEAMMSFLSASLS